MEKFRETVSIFNYLFPSNRKMKILNNRLLGSLLGAKRVTYASGVSFENQLMIITGRDQYDHHDPRQ